MRIGLFRIASQIVWDLIFLFRGDASQYGEEALILSEVGGLGKGTYLEIGAHQPIKCSNTWKLYRKGWRGLCVDPQESFKLNWRLFRPRDSFFPIAITPTEMNSVKFFDFERRVNLVSTIDPVFADEWMRLGYKCRERSVPARTPIQVLRQFESIYGAEPDLILIDVEGMDYLLLKEFFQIIQSTRWILFEDHKEIALDIISSDFTVIGRSGPSVLIARNSTASVLTD